MKSTKKGIPAAQVRQFLSRVEEAHFWTLPSRKDFLIGADGADWLLEASKDGRYQLIDAWSPPNGDPANVLGRLMLFDLANLKLSNQEVY